MGPWVHGFTGPWVHRFMGPRVHGFMGPWVHGPWVHRFMGPWVMGSWVHGFMGSMGPWVHGFTGPWVHGFMGSRVHGSMGPWVHGFMGSWVHGSLPLTVGAHGVRPDCVGPMAVHRWGLVFPGHIGLTPEGLSGSVRLRRHHHVQGHVRTGEKDSQGQYPRFAARVQLGLDRVRIQESA